MAESTLIRGGMVMDGTGAPAVRADVLVRDGRVEDVGQLPDASAAKVIDASGRAVAPGFIDVHTHLDFLLPSPRHPDVLESWARQGVTTLVAGNCGFSPAPMDPERADDVSAYWSFALPHDGLEYQWTTMAEFLDHLEQIGQAFNVAILTGQNVLRNNVMGFEARVAAPEEIAEMKQMLRESLLAGSIGLSLGLFYCPGTYSDTDEITDLAAVLKEFDAPLVPHTRGLTATYDRAIEEVIAVAESHGIPLHLSHHAGGSGDVRERALQAIREAQDRGLSIGHDNIPWACGPTTVLAVLPPRLFDRGVATALRRLGDPVIRKRVVNEIETCVPTWPTWEHGWWTDKFLSFSSRYGGFRLEKNRRFERMTMHDVAEALGKDPYDALFDLLIEEQGRLFMVASFTEDFDDPMGDEFIAHLLSDPDCCVMTDIVGADFDHGNPVAYGAFPKVLGLFARERGVLSQEEAVRRMTSLPAKQMQLRDRGVIRRGAHADITIFDPETVACRASFGDPRRRAEGIEQVLINGQVVLDGGAYDARALAGSVLRRT
jgi:N-acyl-D-aspartate/D-glutamate deacylase